MGAGGPRKPVTPSANINSKWVDWWKVESRNKKGLAKRVKSPVAQTGPKRPQEPGEGGEQEVAIRAPYIRLWAYCALTFQKKGRLIQKWQTHHGGRRCHCPYNLHHTVFLTWKTDWKYIFEMPTKWHGYRKYEHRTSFKIQGSQQVWPLGSCHGKYLMY